MLARALNVHPAVLLFPGWRTENAYSLAQALRIRRRPTESMRIHYYWSCDVPPGVSVVARLQQLLVRLFVRILIPL